MEALTIYYEDNSDMNLNAMSLPNGEESNASAYSWFIRLLNVKDLRDVLFQHISVLDCDALLSVLGNEMDDIRSEISIARKEKESVMTLWMCAMMNLDDRLLNFEQRRLVEIANWKSCSTAAQSVFVLCWDAAMENVAPGLKLFPKLETFICRTNERFFMQVMQERIGTTDDGVRLPVELVLCNRLRYLDLSYCSFKRLPEEWKGMTDLETLNLSYNQSLDELPDWLAPNKKLWSLSLLGCTGVKQVPIGLLARLGMSDVMQHFCERYTSIADIVEGIRTGRLLCSDYRVPEGARTEWTFAKFFQHFKSNAKYDRRVDCWLEVLKVSARTELADQMTAMYSLWCEKMHSRVIRVEKASTSASAGAVGKDQDAVVAPLCRLHHSGFVVVEDGFDEEDPSLS